jgi:integrase
VLIGKLATERTVPLDEETLAAFDEWMAHRGRQRAVPHPRTGQPADLLFVIGGRPIGAGWWHSARRTGYSAKSPTSRSEQQFSSPLCNDLHAQWVGSFLRCPASVVAAPCCAAR